jgi:hypothetical protein
MGCERVWVSHWLVFTYDYMNRRVRKQVYECECSDPLVYPCPSLSWSRDPIVDRRYIHERWNVIMDIDGLPVRDGWAKRCYTWGLDLSGQSGASAVGTGPSPLGLHGAGGIGGL